MKKYSMVYKTNERVYIYYGKSEDLKWIINHHKLAATDYAVFDGPCLKSFASLTDFEEEEGNYGR